MGAVTILINKSGKSIPVYNDEFAGTQIGTITNLELYVEIGVSESGARPVGLYTPSGWKRGYIHATYFMPANSMISAYSSPYAYGSNSYGYKFKILNRQSRIFSGTNQITAVQPGGYVVSDGISDGGSDHPYRLSIKGYYHAGSSTYHAVTNGWCDTDIEVGYSMYNTVTTDALWV